MTAQASAVTESPAARVNAQRIESLYAAIRAADLMAIAACYHEHAKFEDIAFRRNGHREIMEMWRYVCHGKPEISFDANAISTDERTGTGRWRAKYVFGRTDTQPGRPVDNSIGSAFIFQEGIIIEHHDYCDPMAWARQALPFPISLVAGSISPLRRGMAAIKLRKFGRETET